MSHIPIVEDHGYLLLGGRSRWDPVDTEPDPSMARWAEAAAFFDDQGLRIFDLWRAVRVGAKARGYNVRSQLQHAGQDRPCRLRAWVGVPARVLSRLRVGP
jgi:hypothetical protein